MQSLRELSLVVGIEIDDKHVHDVRILDAIAQQLSSLPNLERLRLSFKKDMLWAGDNPDEYDCIVDLLRSAGVRNAITDLDMNLVYGGRLVESVAEAILQLPSLERLRIAFEA
eukprot:tig00000396_g24909.t1